MSQRFRKFVERVAKDNEFKPLKNKLLNYLQKESENKYKLAFANAQDAIIWIDVQSGTVINCNKATENLFGRKTKEIIGHHHTTLSPVGKAEHFHSLLDGSDKDLSGGAESPWQYRAAVRAIWRRGWRYE